MIALEMEASIIDHRISVASNLLPASARHAKVIVMYDEIALSSDVVRQTIALRSAYSIKLPDAVIAATALVKGLKLRTRNQSDFDRVAGVTVVNPFLMPANSLG